jgi:hypothetical protein
MGSFYATCSITDLSITDSDDMYMQLILPSWVNNPYSIDGEQIGCGEKGLRVSNEGPMGEFVPFGFPIEGKYADCGDISNITRTHNIRMLEDFFGISIDEIIGCATDDRWYKHSYKPGIEDNEKEQYAGQFKGWTIGDNKMKNIEILKKLTVTYFKKEHYDFLSKESICDDTYYEKERKERLAKMIKGLSELEKDRPTDIKETFLLRKNVTDDMRKKYSIIKDKGMSKMDFDEMIVYMESSRHLNWWGSKFEYMFYIPTIAHTNMFKLLPIGKQDAEDVKKQYTFIGNMMSLYKVLRPSYYGSQQSNFGAYVKFHEFSTNLVNEKNIKLKSDSVLSDISYILNSSLKNLPNQELIESIKNEIKETLDDIGYEINF